jgi:hypothetical protein
MARRRILISGRVPLLVKIGRNLSSIFLDSEVEMEVQETMNVSGVGRQRLGITFGGKGLRYHNAFRGRWGKAVWCHGGEPRAAWPR